MRRESFRPTGSWSSLHNAIQALAAELKIVLERKDLVDYDTLLDEQKEGMLSDNEYDYDSDSTVYGGAYTAPLTPSKASNNWPSSGTLDVHWKMPAQEELNRRLPTQTPGLPIPRLGFRTLYVFSDLIRRKILT